MLLLQVERNALHVVSRQSFKPPPHCLDRRPALPALLRSRKPHAFSTSTRCRQDDTKAQTIVQDAKKKSEDAESIKPESFQKKKPADPPGNQSLLGEQTVSNKEQRKADWAIIREMSKYLWPKDNLGTRFRVGASVALLVGAKVKLSQHPPYVSRGEYSDLCI